MSQEKIALLKEANAGDIRHIEELPGRWGIENHPAVSISVGVGVLKHLPDRLIVGGGRRIMLIVNNKYYGPPITLYAKREEN